MVDITTEGSRYDRLKPEQRKENLQQGIKALIKAESLLQPMILHIEDAHWIDDDSRTLIENLLRHTADYPFLILITARPERFEPLTLLNLCRKRCSGSLPWAHESGVTELAEHYLETRTG